MTGPVGAERFSAIVLRWKGPLDVPVRLNAAVFRAPEKDLSVAWILHRDEEPAAGAARRVCRKGHALNRERVVAARKVAASVEFMGGAILRLARKKTARSAFGASRKMRTDLIGNVLDVPRQIFQEDGRFVAGREDVDAVARPREGDIEYAAFLCEGDVLLVGKQQRKDGVVGDAVREAEQVVLEVEQNDEVRFKPLRLVDCHVGNLQLRVGEPGEVLPVCISLDVPFENCPFGFLVVPSEQQDGPWFAVRLVRDVVEGSEQRFGPQGVRPIGNADDGSRIMA